MTEITDVKRKILELAPAYFEEFCSTLLYKIGYKNIELSVEDISFNFFESMYEEMLSEKIKNGCKKNGRDYVKELSIFRDKRQHIRYNFENDMEEYRVHIWFLKEFILSLVSKNGGFIPKQFLIDDKNIMTVFTNCADTPECLNDYLKRKCCLTFN